MSYADESYFHKPPRIDEQFGVGQQFSTKSELKVKIADKSKENSPKSPMPYANEHYFYKPPRIDEQFGVGQQFSTKSELKVKIADNIKR
jgi:hypothetical protein